MTGASGSCGALQPWQLQVDTLSEQVLILHAIYLWLSENIPGDVLHIKHMYAFNIDTFFNLNMISKEKEF